MSHAHAPPSSACAPPQTMSSKVDIEVVAVSRMTTASRAGLETGGFVTLSGKGRGTSAWGVASGLALVALPSAPALCSNAHCGCLCHLSGAWSHSTDQSHPATERPSNPAPPGSAGVSCRQRRLSLSTPRHSQYVSDRRPSSSINPTSPGWAALQATVVAVQSRAEKSRVRGVPDESGAVGKAACLRRQGDVEGVTVNTSGARVKRY